jgi:hypothetical protein
MMPKGDLASMEHPLLRSRPGQAHPNHAHNGAEITVAVGAGLATIHDKDILILYQSAHLWGWNAGREVDPDARA